jgi:hypothetical protein
MSATKRVSARALQAIRRTYDSSLFRPNIRFSKNLGREIWASPRISLRRQADLRKNCEYMGIDPSRIGLPPKKEKKPPRQLPPKGEKHERTAAER